MSPRLPAALAAFFALILLPQTALACACGCSVFSVGAGSILPTDHGGDAWVEYDAMDQTRNWNGARPAPAADNEDKRITSQFASLGAQYMFTCGWGVMVEVPVTDRTFRTDGGGGTIDSFHAKALGDIRLTAVYTGLTKAMTTGLTFGVKLPTGDYHAAGFDRDTQIGSGSTDLILGAYHVGALNRGETLTYFVKGAWQVPVITTGGYRPGQTLDAAAGLIDKAASYKNDTVSVSPLLQLVASVRGRDAGPAADPANSGYSRLLVSPGIEVRADRWRLYADVKLPIYQEVRGDQLVAPAFVSVAVSRSF